MPVREFKGRGGLYLKSLRRLLILRFRGGSPRILPSFSAILKESAVLSR
jgi:hypothetical protein